MECGEELIKMGFGLVLIALFVLLLGMVWMMGWEMWLDNTRKKIEIEKEKARVKGEDILGYVSEIKKWVRMEIDSQIATHAIEHILAKHCLKKEKK